LHRQNLLNPKNNANALVQETIEKEVQPNEDDGDFPVDAKGYLLVVTEVTKDEVIFKDPKKLTRVVHSFRLDEIKSSGVRKMGCMASFNLVYNASRAREQVDLLSADADKILGCVRTNIQNYWAYLESLFETYAKDIEKGTPRDFTKLNYKVNDALILVDVAISKDKIVIKKNENAEVLLELNWTVNQTKDNNVLLKYNSVENDLVVEYIHASVFGQDDQRKKLIFNSVKCAELERVLGFTSNWLVEKRNKEDKALKKAGSKKKV